jgi:AcrR family transcriptional regulator
MSVGKKDPRSMHMIENICKAYVELLSEKEGAPFFMKDLFEKANIHKSTFYRHFKNVEAVQDAIEEDVLSKLKNIIRQSDLSDNLHGRRRLLELLNSEIKRDIDYYTKLAGINQRMSFLIKIKNEICAELIETADKNNLLTPFQAKVYYTYTVAGRISVYREWIQGGCRESVDEILKALEIISSSGINGLANFDTGTPNGVDNKIG